MHVNAAIPMSFGSLDQIASVSFSAVLDTPSLRLRRFDAVVRLVTVHKFSRSCVALRVKVYGAIKSNNSLARQFLLHPVRCGHPQNVIGAVGRQTAAPSCS